MSVPTEEKIEASAGTLDRSLAHAVVWNAAARWASQIVSWAATIVIARLLTPYDYGLLGMAALYVNLAMLISQMGIGDAVIALRDLTSRQIAELNTLSLVLGVVLTAVSCVLALPLAHFFSAPPLFGVIVVASLMYLVSAFQVVPKALLQRELRFKLLASIEAGRGVCQMAATVLFAWLHFRYWSLVIGYLVACATNAMLVCTFKRHAFALPHWELLKRELRFTRHVLVSGVAWYIYNNADFGVAGRVLGSGPLGDYSVAWTISSAPIEKITNLVTGVTPAYFSAVQTDKAELRRYLLRLTELLAFVTIPASIGLAMTADLLVSVLLGSKWLGVIGPLRLLGILVAARSIGTILPNLLTAIGDARFVMWSTIGAALVVPIAFLLGSHWGTTGIAGAWVAVYPLIAAPLYLRAFRKTGMKWKEYASAVLPAVGGSLIMATGIWIARLAIFGRLSAPGALILIILVGVISYVGSLLCLHRRRVIELLGMAKRMMRGSGYVQSV
jgi:O-antigen/teichoic acid export membrane protein